jgi:hypothetical protein
MRYRARIARLVDLTCVARYMMIATIHEEVLRGISGGHPQGDSPIVQRSQGDRCAELERLAAVIDDDYTSFKIDDAEHLRRRLPLYTEFQRLRCRSTVR